MDDAVKIKLRELVVQHGEGLAEDPRRCGGLLRDTAGSYRKEIAILVAAAEEGVPRDLLHPSLGASTPGLAARLGQRLENERGLSPEAAAWAVDTWAFALGVTGQRSAGGQVTTGRADLEEQVDKPVKRAGESDRKPSWRNSRVLAAVGVGVVAVAAIVYFFASRDEGQRFNSSRNFASGSEIREELEAAGLVSNCVDLTGNGLVITCDGSGGNGAIAIQYGEDFDGSADAVVGENWSVSVGSVPIEPVANQLGGT